MPNRRKCSKCSKRRRPGAYTLADRRGRCDDCRRLYLFARNLEYRYGITVERYQEMLEAQGGVCAICGGEAGVGEAGKGERLSVDHDHDTGEVAGLTCSLCNTGIGYLRHDPEIVAAALAYVARRFVRKAKREAI